MRTGIVTIGKPFFRPPRGYAAAGTRFLKSRIRNYAAALFANTENREPRPIADLTSTR
jgi:hypothetical protein